MQTLRFIFIVDTENHLNMITRIMSIFSRSRISVHELQTSLSPAFAVTTEEEKDTLRIQRFTITITETKENAIKISRQIKKQVDVLSVNLFEQTI